MKAFLIVMICLMALSAVGKAIMLWNGDFIRKPKDMVIDIGLSIAIIGWTCWLAGGL